jgi:hypothetical protein
MQKRHSEREDGDGEVGREMHRILRRAPYHLRFSGKGNRLNERQMRIESPFIRLCLVKSERRKSEKGFVTAQLNWRHPSGRHS